MGFFLGGGLGKHYFKKCKNERIRMEGNDIKENEESLNGIKRKIKKMRQKIMNKRQSSS